MLYVGQRLGHVSAMFIIALENVFRFYFVFKINGVLQLAFNIATETEGVPWFNSKYTPAA